MAFVAEVDSEFVGMFFRFRRAIRTLGSGGFRYAIPRSGAMAMRAGPRGK